MEEQIAELEGIQYASITFTTKQLRIIADNPDAYLKDIQRICTSIESEVTVQKKTEKSSIPKNEIAKRPFYTSELFAIVCGAFCFILGIIATYLKISELFVIILFILSYLILGSKIILKAVKNISHGQIFDENFLMCIATIGAFAIAEYPEAVGVMLFYRIGEFFEEKAVERSRNQIMEAIDMRPEVVNLLINHEVQVIPAEDAAVGDLIIIRPGDRIPLDGIITEGHSRIDTSPITGEPVPVSAKPGDAVTSGCINTIGQLTIRVEKILAESMVSRILDSVENAAASKPAIDRFITRFAKIYTPIVVFAALAIAVIPSVISNNWQYWIYTALTFLVMSCPCALVLSVPLSFFAGIGTGSKQGILFKGGQSMESLSRIKNIVLDKTGTITKGNFVLQNVISSDGYSEDDLLQVCASCEQFSTHPIAVSIVNAAKEKNITLSEPVQIEEIAGHGIKAHFTERIVLCGNLKLMSDNNIMIPTFQTTNYGSEVYIAINNIYAGLITVSDTIKSDAATSIQKLKKMGMHTIMLTGDSEANAKEIASLTGIDSYYAKLLPQDKLEILQKIRKEYGSALFVGDGINDAPVLAGADVGAAMGSGADAAIEAADIVFMNGNVDAIPESIAISKSANTIAIQNVVFALTIKLIVMILGLIGFANMWMAVFADTGVAMICVLNAIRNLYTKNRFDNF